MGGCHLSITYGTFLAFSLICHIIWEKKSETKELINQTLYMQFFLPIKKLTFWLNFLIIDELYHSTWLMLRADNGCLSNLISMRFVLFTCFHVFSSCGLVGENWSHPCYHASAGFVKNHWSRLSVWQDKIISILYKALQNHVWAEWQGSLLHTGDA